MESEQEVRSKVSRTCFSGNKEMRSRKIRAGVYDSKKWELHVSFQFERYILKGFLSEALRTTTFDSSRQAISYVQHHSEAANTAFSVTTVFAAKVRERGKLHYTYFLLQSADS